MKISENHDENRDLRRDLFDNSNKFEILIPPQSFFATQLAVRSSASRASSLSSHLSAISYADAFFTSGKCSASSSSSEPILRSLAEVCKHVAKI